MAATWLKPLKIKQGKTSQFAVAAVIDYVENPQKTDNGRLITSYECDSRTADEEFLISKREYEFITGRNQGKRNVLAYHIRQSFKPGEISPEEANEIGRQLALSFTKGKHAFVVATHIDRQHTHNHIIFNSTAIDCTRKFSNFWGSSKAIRRISDLLCAEHGLSIIENPAPSKGSYGDWLGDGKTPLHKDILKRIIDELVPTCATFEDFLAKLRADGYEVSTKRKHITVMAPDWKQATRLDTLKGDYTEAAIRARLGIEKTITTSSDSGTLFASLPSTRQVSLLIDIQEKIREGKGAGYAQWAKIFNLKQAAQTLLFLQENGIDSYEDLLKKSSSASDDFSAMTTRIKDIETRLKAITELQKQIGTYGKTRDVYAKYKAAKWSRTFYDEHTADIILHRAAKKFFDEQGFKGKLPSISSLKQEYATLAAEKKTLYGDYHKVKDNSHELTIARDNAERILGITKRDTSHEQTKRNAHEI
jgi:hypothetical protein